MNSNWFKLVMKMTKVEYGKNLLLKGVEKNLTRNVSVRKYAEEILKL